MTKPRPAHVKNRPAEEKKILLGRILSTISIGANMLTTITQIMIRIFTEERNETRDCSPDCMNSRQKRELTTKDLQYFLLRFYE